MVAALNVRGLTVGIPGQSPLLNDVSFDVAAGERLGLVGESGSGKSLTAAAICGLLRSPIAVRAGSICLEGTDLSDLSAKAWRQFRGSSVFQIFQSPGTALTPRRRIGPQLAEIAGGTGSDRVSAALRAVQLDPQVAGQFPYQLSGGMKQRVLIAMALILRPRILIADEPTTGLDVLTERETLLAIDAVALKTGAAVLFISHDLRAVREVADRVLVLQNGRLVEDCHIDGLAASPAPAAQRLGEAAIALQKPS
ncbi:ABC transporter ATP-binding protein [Actibacterium sp. 188UL27-1]|uniref:ATP-binding cassette domain-containing protein n=1 Tax=Actibacterium sp. 188UL27-1 TaxID=2786961 RepID=UPI00195CE526|nr:ABC transporter ATP-binding protein [Actibacterium sp. 188UL27-1]MBM7068653.1 ABC transporter ATP-binding protein [Actibacterium sp. 188UL27-1]